MTGKLIGYYRSYGKFKPEDKPNEIEFDNVVLQFLSELGEVHKDNSTIEGKRVKFSECKFKLKYFHDKVNLGINRVSELDDYIGKPFSWSFNEFGNIERVDPI